MERLDYFHCIKTRERMIKTVFLLILNFFHVISIVSDGLTKREAWCKKSKGRPLFSVLKKGN